MLPFLRRGYAVQSLDGTKPNTNPKTNPNPNTNLTVPYSLTLFANPNRKIITLLTELEYQTPAKMAATGQILNK